MSTSQHQLGFLQALEDDGNTLRDGQNPVVIQSGSVKRRLPPNTRASVGNGDVIEFLPGKLRYKLVSELNQEEPVPLSDLDLQNVKSTRIDTSQISEIRTSESLLQEDGTSEITKKREWEVILIDDDEDEQAKKKQKQQLLDDEAIARALQDEEDRDAKASTGEYVSSSSGHHAGASSSFRSSRVVDNDEHSFGTEYEAGCRSSSTFRLMQVKGLPRWANIGCVNIGGVIQGDIQVALLSNYMVDIDWLLEGSACLVFWASVPKEMYFFLGALQLRNVVATPASMQSVVMCTLQFRANCSDSMTLVREPFYSLPTPENSSFSGHLSWRRGGSLELLQASKPNSWLLHKPPLRLSYGTHHSKAMFLIYPTGVRVVVHTANLIYIDWNNKSQGLWMQDFPYKSKVAQESKSSPFENDLVEYLQALEWGGCMVVVSGLGEVRVNAAFFRRFDYSSALVRLVASVPGYHQGRNLTKWGHLKLRTILQEQCFEEQFKGSPCVYQFSSLGSLDEKWLGEFASSLQAGSTFGKEKLGPGSVQIIWPTVEDIRCSIEGYAAGGAVPSPLKNVERPFLSKYWSRWQADHTGRSRAIPHIKTFVRYNNQSLAWFLLTSSNLSKAAWGALQKNNSQLMIRSYELGVLFLPSLIGINSNANPFSCTYITSALPRELQHTADDEDKKLEDHPKLATLSWKNNNDGKQGRDIIVRLPLPYALPPVKYGPKDTPWSWDRQYTEPDVCGEVWPRQVRRYTKQLH